MAERIIKLPDVGEGVAEAELSEWHVAVGDTVQEDQTLATVTTDKVTVEIPSPVGGTVTALGTTAGSILAVGAELVRIAMADGTPMATPPPEPTIADAPAAPVPDVAEFDKPMASPAVRRRAADAGIDLRSVEGSGPGGRIRHGDLDRVLHHQPASMPPAPQDGVAEIRITGIRRAIARQMAESTRRIAHFSYIEEVDMTALEELRAALRKQDGRPRLSVLPFVVLATVRAIASFPQMNARFDDDADILRRHTGIHVGIATQTPSGLVVPVLRHAGTLDLWACAAGIARLSKAARNGTASRAELEGSTITITSLGALGGIATTPVINRPEVAIIGINKVATRPMWRDAGVVPRQMMNLSSSFDHRVIDGMDAASFIQRIKGFLEAPATIFIPDP